MKRLAMLAMAMSLTTVCGIAHGQSLNARRTAMGGVLLPGGPGSESLNPAYRAVPRAGTQARGVPLPIGLIPLVSDPPVVDPDDPEFNVYELVNTLYNPPWNLQLTSSDPPSDDIVVNLGRDHLSIELGEIAGLFPKDESRADALVRMSLPGLGLRGFFVGTGVVGEFENSLRMNQPLHAAVTGGEPFRTNTEYTLFDDGRGQVAAAAHVGWAGAISRATDETVPGAGVYVGVRPKLLRGLVYGDAQNRVSFSTGDSLFSSDPIEIDYAAAIRTAGPDGGGWGGGADVGLVWRTGRFEVGLGLNDLASEIVWKVEESVMVRDSAGGDYERQVVAQDVTYRSRLPQTTTANIATRLGRFLVAADVVHRLERTSAHLGAETWLGPWAMRGGLHLDPNQDLQYAGGVGVRIGWFGVDAAVATHSRNLERTRGVELGAGLSLYR